MCRPYRAHCRAGIRWSSIPDRSSTCYLRRWPAACSGWSPAYRSPALAARQGDAFDANQEVRAQGLSNLLGPWLSASLSAGSFTRSGLNLEAGARSPLAGAFSALWVALLAVLGARLIEHVPLPAMAAGILLIAWGLIDRPALRALYRSGRAECLVAGLTALATLLLPLQNAIYAGVLASLVFYLRRTSTPRVLRQRNDEEEVLRIEARSSSAPATTCNASCANATGHGWCWTPAR